jgi:hypothetical protein
VGFPRSALTNHLRPGWTTSRVSSLRVPSHADPPIRRTPPRTAAPSVPSHSKNIVIQERTINHRLQTARRLGQSCAPFCIRPDKPAAINQYMMRPVPPWCNVARSGCEEFGQSNRGS